MVKAAESYSDYAGSNPASDGALFHPHKGVNRSLLKRLLVGSNPTFEKTAPCSERKMRTAIHKDLT